MDALVWYPSREEHQGEIYIYINGCVHVQVGRPTTRRRSALAAGVENARGLGAYGFNPNHHLTEEDVTPRARTVLMNEWGYLWDLSRPVLMEKSPPNMIISTFLQEIFSTGDHPRVDETAQTQMAVPGGKYDGSDGGSTTRARFLFISRHPIANALALAKYLAGGLGSDGLPDMFEQVLHWVVSHEIMREDMERLEHARVIRLVSMWGWGAVPPFFAPSFFFC